MHSSRRPAALTRFFTGLAEHAFQIRMGVCDPPIADYLADLLARFVHADAINGVLSVKGRRLVQVVEMVSEAEQRLGEARRRVHRHIGDYTLFWTGVFPEALPKMQAVDRMDSLVSFSEQGKRSYSIASQACDESSEEECALLERLSREYELCMFALGEIRREWQELDGEPGAPPRIWVN